MISREEQAKALEELRVLKSKIEEEGLENSSLVLKQRIISGLKTAIFWLETGQKPRL